MGNNFHYNNRYSEKYLWPNLSLFKTNLNSQVHIAQVRALYFIEDVLIANCFKKC